MSSLRKASTVSGSAFCPRISSARSPGRASTPIKKMIEMANRVRIPRPTRLITNPKTESILTVS